LPVLPPFPCCPLPPPFEYMLARISPSQRGIGFCISCQWVGNQRFPYSQIFWRLCWRAPFLISFRLTQQCLFVLLRPSVQRWNPLLHSRLYATATRSLLQNADCKISCSPCCFRVCEFLPPSRVFSAGGWRPSTPSLLGNYCPPPPPRLFSLFFLPPPDTSL